MKEVLQREFIPEKGETHEKIVKRLEALEECQCAYVHGKGADATVRALFFQKVKDA